MGRGREERRGRRGEEKREGKEMGKGRDCRREERKGSPWCPKH